MAYTQNGTYYNEETHYETRPNIIVSRNRRSVKKEDFHLNFRLSEEVLEKFSSFCQNYGFKKSKILKIFIIDAVDNDLDLKQFEKYINPSLINNRNIAIKINKNLYDSFVNVCHEKGYEEVSEVLRSFMVYASVNHEEVSKKASKKFAKRPKRKYTRHKKLTEEV